MSLRRIAPWAAPAVALGVLAALAGAPAADSAAASTDPAADGRRTDGQLTIRMTTIPTPRPGAMAEQINDAGVVIGSFHGAIDERAFRWEDGVTVELADFGLGRISDAVAINERGQVLGRAERVPHGLASLLWEPDGTVVDLGHVHATTGLNDLGAVAGGLASEAVIWRRGDVTRLGDLGGDFLLTATDGPAMNNAGQVVGSASIDRWGTRRAFLWTGDELVALPTPDGTTSLATGINSRGQVLGTIFNEEESVSVIWDGDDVVRIPFPPGWTYTSARAMNDRGAVVGFGGAGGDGAPQRAFLYDDGTTVDLGTLPGTHSSVATAINRRGQVVGSTYSPPFRLRAVLWQDGQIIDLGSLGGGESQALDINRRGQIVGYSTDADGVAHAVLWTVERTRR